MQQIADLFSVVLVENEGSGELKVETEAKIWKPRRLFGSATSGPSETFSAATGVWEPRKLLLHVVSHEVAQQNTSSSSDSDDVEELLLTKSLSSLATTQKRDQLRCRRRSISKKRFQTQTILEGCVQLLKVEEEGTNRIFTRETVEIDSIAMVGRFEVPSSRSIPFELTRDEMRAHLADAGDERSWQTKTTSSSDESGKMLSSLTSLPTVIAPSSPTFHAQSPAANRDIPITLSEISKATSKIEKAVKKTIATSHRVVYTCGTIGLKWQTNEGAWTYLAFRTTEECFRWASSLRLVIVSQLRFQTFHDVFETKLKFTPDLLTQRPDARQLVDFIVTQQEGASFTKVKNVRSPPNGGVIKLVRGTRRNKWKVFLDDEATPHSATMAPQMLHWVKLGKTFVEQPRDALINVTLRFVTKHSINLRECTIHVPRPFSNQFFIRCFDRTHRRQIELEAEAESMDERILWEEWLQTFGAVKILSEEELEAKEHIIGGASTDDENISPASGDTASVALGERGPSLEGVEQQVTAEQRGQRGRPRSGSRGPQSGNGRQQAFAWTPNTTQRQASGQRRRSSSQRAMSPVGSSPSFPRGGTAGESSPGHQYLLPSVLTNKNSQSRESSFAGDNDEPFSHASSSPGSQSAERLPQWNEPNSFVLDGNEEHRSDSRDPRLPTKEILADLLSQTPHLDPVVSTSQCTTMGDDRGALDGTQTTGNDTTPTDAPPHASFLPRSLSSSLIVLSPAVLQDAPSPPAESHDATLLDVSNMSSTMSPHAAQLTRPGSSAVLAELEDIIPTHPINPNDVASALDSDLHPQTVEGHPLPPESVLQVAIMPRSLSDPTTSGRSQSPLLSEGASFTSLHTSAHIPPKVKTSQWVNAHAPPAAQMVAVGQKAAPSSSKVSATHREEFGASLESSKALSSDFSSRLRLVGGLSAKRADDDESEPTSPLDKKRFLSSLKSMRVCEVDVDSLSSEATSPRVVESNLSLSDEDEELMSVSPQLRKAYLKNMQQRQQLATTASCPLCNQIKAAVEICSATGRKHVIVSSSGMNHHTNSTTVRVPRREGSTLTRTPSRFERPRSESPAVTAARILLDLQ